MGRFSQERILSVLCHFKQKLCWTAVAKPDLLDHFFQLFGGMHDRLITLPQPTPPTNALKCTAMHSNSAKYTELCHFLKNFAGLLWPNLIC